MELIERLPPPVHMEWLVALSTSIHNYHQDSEYLKPRPTIADAQWLEVNPWPEHRKSLSTKCPHCNRKLTDEELRSKVKWKHRKDYGATLSIDYVRVPPAIREAAGANSSVAYWFGQCHWCKRVYWAADDGQPARKR